MTTLVVALLSTVVALIAVVITGRAAKRGAHYTVVVITLGCLTWAIREAELVGRGLVYEGAAATVKTVHFVGVGAVFVLLPILAVSGIRLARLESPERRTLHVRLAVAFLAAVVITCLLGTAMTMMAEPLEFPGTGG
jgi:hypothetical protein